MVTLATIQDIAEWTNENLHRDIKIKDVAERSGYSAWHLQRAFRQTTGISLGAYIRERRLAAAAAALAGSDMSIAQICTAFGFQSRPAFTRTFTRYAGMTPGRYRTRAKTAPASGLHAG